MNEKDKIKLLISLVLIWVIIFTWRSIFFSNEERRVPLKFTNTPAAAKILPKETNSDEDLPELVSDNDNKTKEITLGKVKNIFAPLAFYIPPPPPKPEPPAPQPPKLPPEPHPLEATLKKLEFMGNATKNNQPMVFLTYKDDIYQVSEGTSFMDDQLEVSAISVDKLRIRIKGTEIEREIHFK